MEVTKHGKHICRYASIGILEVHFVTVPNAQEGSVAGRTAKSSCWTYHANVKRNPRRSKASDECFNNAAIDQGYDIRLSSPCLHYNREEDRHGWRHGDDLVFEGEENWLDELQKALERVMILKRQAKLVWHAGDDKHVTQLNRLIDFRDSGGERVVTLEPDPRHMDLLRELVA